MNTTLKKMAVVLAGSALALSMGITAIAADTAVSSGGEQGDTSAYGYLAGKAGREDSETAYAGKNFIGGKQDDTSAYSYLAGSEGNASRHARFGQISSLTSDEERASFFAENGIGGDGPNSRDSHMDVNALVSAGIIDQDTADAVKEYAAAKHQEIHARYANMGSKTPQERHDLYAGFSRENGDSVESLLQSGVITQAQADAIRGFLAE